MMQSAVESPASTTRVDSILSFALCCDSAFYEGLETAVCSALVSSHRNSQIIRVYVVDGGLEPIQKRQLDSHVARLAEHYSVTATVIWKNCRVDGYEKVKAFRGHNNYYVRLLLANIIPEEDWVVWIDADIFSMKDFSGINRQLNTTHALAAVVDHGFPTLGSEDKGTASLNTRGFDLELPYFNAGLAVFNLKLWREEGLIRKLLDWGSIHVGKSRFKDQSILNWNLADRTKFLPNEYNVFGHQGPLIVNMVSNPLNFHAAGSNKFWAIKLSPALKHAELTFGEAVATYHYLKFRQKELGTDESRRLLDLREAVLQHHYLKPFRAVQRAYTLKLIAYALLLNPSRFRLWSQRKKIHKQLHERAGGMLNAIASEISSHPGDG